MSDKTKPSLSGIDCLLVNRCSNFTTAQPGAEQPLVGALDAVAAGVFGSVERFVGSRE